MGRQGALADFMASLKTCLRRRCFEATTSCHLSPRPSSPLLHVLCKPAFQAAFQAPDLDAHAVASFPWGKEHPTGVRDPILANGWCHHSSLLAACSIAHQPMPRSAAKVRLLLVSHYICGRFKKTVVSPPPY